MGNGEKKCWASVPQVNYYNLSYVEMIILQAGSV